MVYCSNKRVSRTIQYCYENENSVPLFNIKNDKEKINNNKYIKHFISKPTTTSMRRKKVIEKYAKAQTKMFTQTTMKSQQCPQENENTNLQLQERSLDCENIKGKDEAYDEQ